MAKHNKAMAAVRAFLVCLTFFIIQSLHSKLPVYFGDQKINLSWKEAPKPSVPANAAVTDQKRATAASTAGNGSSTNANKKGRGADGTREDLASYLFP